jgi:hypothetical protein
VRPRCAGAQFLRGQSGDNMRLGRFAPVAAVVTVSIVWAAYSTIASAGLFMMLPGMLAARNVPADKIWLLLAFMFGTMVLGASVLFGFALGVVHIARVYRDSQESPP